jgi:hypothetical protein
MKCPKCGSVLNTCTSCKGRGNTSWTTCSTCNNTGQVCAGRCGKYWK